jgi:hypothetical protein
MKTKTIGCINIAWVLCGLFFSTNLFPQLTGREIIRKVEESPDGDNRKSLMTMQLVNHRGATRERSILSYSMDLGKGQQIHHVFFNPRRM